MRALESVLDKARALNDPYLVARFQKLCQIDISYSDSGFSTAASDSEISSSSLTSSSINIVDDDVDIERENLSRNDRRQYENLKDTKSADPADGIVIGNSHSHFNGSVTRKRTQGRKTLNKMSRNNYDNYLYESSMENQVSYKIRNRFLYYLFSFGSALGNESFYCFFFSYWFWNIDGFVCRRVVIIWAMSMYIGQAAKDVIRWPRPSSPPVAKLEKRYDLEYGMPSTHAMVAFSIPFSILVLTSERYIYSWPIMFVVCICWCSLICFSRCYLGMHSFLDVVCGLLFSMILTPILLRFVGAIDHFQLTNSYSPIVMIVVTLFLAFCYPTLDKWSTARGDTVLILGVMAGIALASRIAYSQGLYTAPTLPPPYSVKLPDADFVLTTIVRMFLGGTILSASRSTMKFILSSVLCALFRIPRHDAKSLQRLMIELPYKYITYAVVAFNVVYTAPLVFKFVGVYRDTKFTNL